MTPMNQALGKLVAAADIAAECTDNYPCSLPLNPKGSKSLIIIYLPKAITIITITQSPST